VQQARSAEQPLDMHSLGLDMFSAPLDTNAPPWVKPRSRSRVV
jgi:hypothetical protein